MHDALILVHSWLRWVVLAGLLGVTAMAARGWRAGRPLERAHRRAVAVAVGVADLQLLLGLLLYAVVGPWLSLLLAHPGRVMASTPLRFFAVEHAFGMITALVVVHVSSALSRRAPDDRRAWRRLALGSGVALLIVVATIPWPFMPYPRPLLRLG